MNGLRAHHLPSRPLTLHDRLRYALDHAESDDEAHAIQDAFDAEIDRRIDEWKERRAHGMERDW